MLNRWAVDLKRIGEIMDVLFTHLESLLKLPFIAIFKTLITLLNIIPLPIYEVFGARGNSADNRPDLRALHSKIRSKKRAHLGTVIIAWTRGAIFKAPLNSSGASCWGIYSEDYNDIQKKYVW